MVTLKGVTPGIYHYRRQLKDREMRLHLRVDPDGAGILSVNASGVLHLNATAVLLMKHILDGKDKDVAIKDVLKVYIGTTAEVEQDYDKLMSIIAHLDTTEDACPVMSVTAGSIPPFGRKVTAPYRADLALTYACANKCQHCYVSRKAEEVKPLAVAQWKQVLERLWQVGVPYVCFTGGEATESPYLIELIEKAEDIGMITGLLTNGRLLKDKEFVQKLCAAGLDHVQITLESHDEKIHDDMVGCVGAFKETVQGIRDALEEDLYLVTNTTLCQLNIENIDETVAFLKELGVKQFAMNSIICTGKAPESGLGIEEEDLEPILGEVTEEATRQGLRFIWYTPTHYCRLNPAVEEVGFKRCTAAEYNICIEPDGQVIPCQSYYQPVGHILHDSWDSIWNSKLFQSIRNRDERGEECTDCPDFEVCGSGCPLSDGERFLCTDSTSEG